MLQIRIVRPVLILMQGEIENVAPKICSVDQFINLQGEHKADSIAIFAGPRWSDQVDILKVSESNVVAIAEGGDGHLVKINFTGEQARRLWKVLLQYHTPYKCDPKYEGI